MPSEMMPSKTKVIIQERLVPGWHLPVLAAFAANKKSLDLEWENIKSIAKAQGIFAVALAYSNSKKDDHNRASQRSGRYQWLSFPFGAWQPTTFTSCAEH